MPAPIECGCGLVHEEPETLEVVGWQPIDDDESALLVNCTCGSTICARLEAASPKTESWRSL